MYDLIHETRCGIKTSENAMRNDASRAAISPLPRLKIAKTKKARLTRVDLLGGGPGTSDDLPVDLSQCYAEPLFNQQR